MEIYGSSGVDDAHHIRFLHDQQVLTGGLNLGAAPLAEEDAVTSLNGRQYTLATLITGTRSNSYNHPFGRLFFHRIGYDDAALRLSLHLLGGGSPHDRAGDGNS